MNTLVKYSYTITAGRRSASDIVGDIHFPSYLPLLPFPSFLFRPIGSLSSSFFSPFRISLTLRLPHPFLMGHKAVCLTARGPGERSSFPSGPGRTPAANAFGAFQFKISAFGVAFHSLFGSRGPNHRSIFGGNIGFPCP